jgi:hypothetical protein
LPVEAVPLDKDPALLAAATVVSSGAVWLTLVYSCAYTIPKELIPVENVAVTVSTPLERLIHKKPERYISVAPASRSACACIHVA